MTGPVRRVHPNHDTFGGNTMSAATFGVPHAFTPRAIDVDALQFVYREVSKEQIRRFCPQANVGANIDDDYDIRWITIDSNGTPTSVGDGEWIVRHHNHTFEVVSEGDFRQRYVPADTFRAGQHWLIQCTPDPFRREPRNVGVVLAVTDERVIGRFLAFTDVDQQTELGMLHDILNGPISADYRAAIKDLTTAIRTDSWMDALARVRRNPHPLQIVSGGSFAGGDRAIVTDIDDRRLASLFRDSVLPSTPAEQRR